MEEILHSRTGAPDKEGYRQNDTIDEVRNDHGPRDIVQLSSFSVRIFLICFRSLHRLRLKISAGPVRCVDHDV